MTDSADWLTVTQAAARLGVSERTVQRRCKSGKLLARRIGEEEGVIWLVAWPPRIAVSGDATTTHGATTTDHVPLYDASATYASQNADAATTSDGVPTDGTTTGDTDLARIQGYVARDLELMLSRAIAEAQTPLLGRIEALVDSNQAQAAHVEALTEEIKQLAAVQAAQVAENAALRSEVEMMAATQMAAQLAAVAPESTSEVTPTTINDALTESLVPYLEQVQEVSAEVDRVKEENERLKKELQQGSLNEKAKRPWWKIW